MSDKDNEREFFDQDRVEPLRRSDRRHRQKFANPFRNVRKKDNFQNESQHFDEQKLFWPFYSCDSLIFNYV